MTGVGVQHSASLISVTRLLLNRWNISNESLRHSESSMPLRYLNLHNCNNVTDSGVQQLGLSISLTKFHLGDSCAISDEGARHMGSMMGLRDLNLGFLQADHRCRAASLASVGIVDEILIGWFF